MKPLKITLIAITTSLLTSCSFFGGHTSTSIDPGQPDKGDGYSKVETFRYDLQDVNAKGGMINLESLGNSKILVVPVVAKGAISWTEAMLSNVQKAFFGKDSDTGWQSVSSFYESSSYGQIHISGEVAPVLESQYTVNQLSQSTSNRPDELIAQEFEASSKYTNLRKQYDTNSDGFIDAVVFMYSNEIDYDSGYWAWVYWGSSDADTSNPTINSYMWASYNFVYGSQSKQGYPYAAYGDKVDGHTVIHESGHLLGLDDYYCYDENGWDPSGTIEMHSNNIGDENIYSKMALNWVKPYYVKTTSSVELTLRSSALYGDAIIINDDWNGSPCDEYLAIEYYSPDGMNAKDASKPYPGNNYQMYTSSGFRIYHIDARVVQINNRGAFIKYSDDISDANFYSIGASNSESYSYLAEHKGDYKQVHLLEAGGKNTFKSGKYATNATLFTKGKTFEASSEFFYNGTKFNDGSEVGYKITVLDSSTYQGKIKIEKI